MKARPCWASEPPSAQVSAHVLSWPSWFRIECQVVRVCQRRLVSPVCHKASPVSHGGTTLSQCQSDTAGLNAGLITSIHQNVHSFLRDCRTSDDSLQVMPSILGHGSTRALSSLPLPVLMPQSFHCRPC